MLGPLKQGRGYANEDSALRIRAGASLRRCIVHANEAQRYANEADGLIHTSLC